jgi:hypothetical protein
MFQRIYVNFRWSPQKSKIGVYCSYGKERAVTQLIINKHNRIVIQKAKENVSVDMESGLLADEDNDFSCLTEFL